MSNFTLNSIGKISVRGDETVIELGKKYIPALTGLDGFSHIQVLWWFDGCDNEQARSVLTVDAPYKNSPDVLGIFATRSPARPNPLALTPSYVTYIDYENGIIGLSFIDANDGSPVLDIKPYTPSLDRIEEPSVPYWCKDWPKSNEESANFDWSSVFNF